MFALSIGICGLFGLVLVKYSFDAPQLQKTLIFLFLICILQSKFHFKKKYQHKLDTLYFIQYLLLFSFIFPFFSFFLFFLHFLYLSQFGRIIAFFLQNILQNVFLSHLDLVVNSSFIAYINSTINCLFYVKFYFLTLLLLLSHFQ